MSKPAKCANTRSKPISAGDARRSWAGALRTSENLPEPNFAELRKGEVRRIPLLRLYEKSSNSDEPPRHEANHRSVHQRFSARTKSLVVFAHPPVVLDPSDRPLHHPPTR